MAMIKISIAPIQYCWDKKKVVAFYEELQGTQADIVYLGETVCSKRRELNLEDWLQIAEDLAKAGKEVILSSLSLIEAGSELASLQKIAENNIYRVEANDVAAVQLLAGHGQFVLGPHINIYNSETLAFLHELGANRWVSPIELGKDTITQLHTNRPPGLETEIFAYGRLPLAFSARCFTARAHNKSKDECESICGNYPDGLPLYTQDEESFLVLNGIQVQSATVHNLVAHLGELSALEIDVIRIDPQAEGLNEIIASVRSVLDGQLHSESALKKLEQYQSFGSCDGYWRGEAGMTPVIPGKGISVEF
jgi:collagenase-like PrtC family protease